MKLNEKYSQYQELFNRGFRFNPEDKIIFKPKHRNSFVVPEEMENWTVQESDKDEYLNQRLDELGITPEENGIELFSDLNGRGKSKDLTPIFTSNDNGDIEILQYSLTREAYTFAKSQTSAGVREDYYCQRRLNPNYADFCEGKYDYKDGIVTPFWPPDLVAKYENSEAVETLVITEGQIKSFKATKEGIPTVGLTSISHFREKQTGKIHREIVMFIQRCNVQNVVVLWDGDCRDISTKDLTRGRDLSKRPRDFYKYACEIKDLIAEFFPKQKIKYFFGTINKLETDNPPKGIDDLLIFIKKPTAVLNELKQIGEIPGKYLFFQEINTEAEKKRLRKWFHLEKPGDFYHFHESKIGKNKFVYFGSTYEIKDGHPVISIPADMKVYMRIGISYYKMIKRPVPSGIKGETMLEEILEPWSADAIKLDHGKELFAQVQKFEGFTNIASHTNYQQIIDGHWNLYADLQHQKREGDFPTIKKLLEHLFGDRYRNGMIMDYLTILYRFPMQKLPIIVLASRLQNTGKSTFINLVKMIFKQNMTIVSAKDFTNDFTSHWVSKLVVACEETVFEKKEIYEMLKAKSTSNTVNRNEKNKAQTEIPNMLHFIFATNYEDSFIKIDESDSRLWIEKVNAIPEKDPKFNEKLEFEIPELVNELERREIVNPYRDRLWFAEDSYKTEAFYNVVKKSEPASVREMRERFRDLFFKFPIPETRMTADDIRTHFQIKGEITYINQLIKQYFNAERVKNAQGKEYVTTYAFPVDGNEIKGKGRPFVFLRETFLTEEEIKRLTDGSSSNLPF